VKDVRSAYLQLHLAVLLFGFTAILGNLIEMSAVMIVWWRVFITSISLLFLINFKDEVLSMPRTLLLKYMGIGCLIALHWVCFYGAIKLANSSIALICAATVAFFTSMLEPLILRRKFDPVELLLGFLIIPGMYVIVQHVDVGYLYGIGVGLVASFLAAIFSILNKRYVTEASPYVINFVEMVSATLLVSFLIPLSGNILELGPLLPQRTLDWGYLLVLALVCTTFTNVITLKSLRHLTAFGSNLVFNFEPLYGIVLAAVLLREYEQLTTGFYIGGAMIISIVLLYPVLQRNRKKPTI